MMSQRRRYVSTSNFSTENFEENETLSLSLFTLCFATSRIAAPKKHSSRARNAFSPRCTFAFLPLSRWLSAELESSPSARVEPSGRRLLPSPPEQAKDLFFLEAFFLRLSTRLFFSVSPLGLSVFTPLSSRPFREKWRVRRPGAPRSALRGAVALRRCSCC